MPPWPDRAGRRGQVLRPNIERLSAGPDAFYLAAIWIERLAPFLPPAPDGRGGAFRRRGDGRADLRLECSAASEFADNTAGDAGLIVPKPVWPLSGRSVMTIAWAEGIGLNELAAMDAAGIDRVALGARVLQLFLSHALRDGFFHGDMHQGNLKVTPSGDLIAYDFGIMGRIDEYTRRVYAEILMGFIRKDYRRVAEIHFEAGYVPADRDIDEFARALRAVGEPILAEASGFPGTAAVLPVRGDRTLRDGKRTELILCSAPWSWWKASPGR